MTAAPAEASTALPWVTSGEVALSPQRCSRCLLPLPVLDVAERLSTHSSCAVAPTDITTAKRRKRR